MLENLFPGVSDMVRLKPAYESSETSYNFEILHVASLAISLPRLPSTEIDRANLICEKKGCQEAWVIEVTEALKIFSSETADQNTK